MILIPSFTKKHAAALLLSAAAVTTTIVAVQNKEQQAPTPIASAPVVTMSGYQAQAGEVVAGFVAGDVNAVSGTLNRLLALSVPAEGMQMHFELASILTTYKQALSLGDQIGITSSLNRLKVFSQQNDWVGLVINE